MASLVAGSPGVISGLQMEWASGNSYRLTSGYAYVPSVDGVVTVASTITKTGQVLNPNSWYHLYLFQGAGGAGDCELSATAPAAPYSGTARAKTGDTSRRYLGSVRTNASGQMYRFVQTNEDIHYLETIGGGTPFRILSSGAATGLTSVSTAAVVPITSRRAEFQFINGSAGSQFMLVSPPDVSADVLSVAAGSRFMAYFALVNGAVGYYMSAASGAAFIDVHGYTYER